MGSVSSKKPLFVTAMVVSLAAVFIGGVLTIAKHQQSKKAVTAEEQYIRLWTDQKNDSYIRMGLSSKSVKMFGSAKCEDGLWMLATQVNMLQSAKLESEKKANGELGAKQIVKPTIKGRATGDANSKKSN